MLDFIRKCDIFAVNVQMTYKGSQKFNTLLGGSCTFTLVLAMIIAFPWLLVDQIKNPTYSGKQHIGYLGSTKETYILMTTNNTLAGNIDQQLRTRVSSDNTQQESFYLESLLRVTFTTTDKDAIDGDGNTGPIQAVRCADLYKSEIDR